MPTYDDAFKTNLRGECGEEAGVAFADCETALKGTDWGGGLNIPVEEGDGVVSDVVVKPGEYASCLVRCGREGSCQLRR